MDRRQGVKRKIQEATVETTTKKSMIDKDQEVLKVRLEDEPLNLECRWASCDIRCATWEIFEAHLSSHVAIDMNHCACRWVNCKYNASGSLLKRHISYHGYISKLCNIGENTAERRGLAECRQPEKLVIPVNENGYFCQWQQCHANFITIYEFLKHLVIHIKGTTKSENGKIMCCWRHCDNAAGFSNRTKLSDHLRKHSGEKEVACPTCITTFSNKTIFSDHRTRQGSESISSCPFCAETFQSERIMRKHSRSHAQSLACPMCGSSFATNSDLKAHLKTHDKENAKDDRRDGRYGCHLCSEEFVRSAFLTEHLKETHSVALPVGYRFCFQRGSDGVYRLKFLRLNWSNNPAETSIQNQ